MRYHRLPPPAEDDLKSLAGDLLPGRPARAGRPRPSLAFCEFGPHRLQAHDPASRVQLTLLTHSEDLFRREPDELRLIGELLNGHALWTEGHAAVHELLVHGLAENPVDALQDLTGLPVLPAVGERAVGLPPGGIRSIVPLHGDHGPEGSVPVAAAEPDMIAGVHLRTIARPRSSGVRPGSLAGFSSVAVSAGSAPARTGTGSRCTSTCGPFSRDRSVNSKPSWIPPSGDLPSGSIIGVAPSSSTGGLVPVL